MCKLGCADTCKMKPLQAWDGAMMERGGVVWAWGLRPPLANVKGRSIIETTCFLVLSPLREAKSSPYIMAICGDQTGHQMRSAQRYACLA